MNERARRTQSAQRAHKGAHKGADVTDSTRASTGASITEVPVKNENGDGLGATREKRRGGSNCTFSFQGGDSQNPPDLPYEIASRFSLFQNPEWFVEIFVKSLSSKLFPFFGFDLGLK